MTVAGAPLPGPSPMSRLSRRAAGWAVHAFTASGAVIGLLAMLAVIRDDARTALLWLAAALAVDALDGPIARKLRVREVLPRVDGAVLDLVVDYLTYVLVPAVFLYWFDLMPAGWGLAGAGFILLTSLYCFANVEMKTSDNYFSGFPAIWNVVVLYLWLLETPALVNAVVVLVLGVLTFVPMKFVHPVRVREARIITYSSMLVWTSCALWLVLMAPERPAWLLAPWLGSSAWLAFVSVRRTLRGPVVT
jgi:phosphatidylcholine synthase